MGCSPVGNPSEAVLELFYGGDTPAEEPFFAFHGLPEQGLTLWGAYEIGDIDGDSLTDWIVAYRTADFSEKWLYLYISATELPAEPTLAMLDFFEPWDEEIGISGAGDVNGDGFDDLYIHGQEFGYDHAMMWFGSSELDTLPDWEIEGEDWYVWIATSAREDGTGDVNGDGFDDVMNMRFLQQGPFEVFWGGVQPATVSDTIGYNPTQQSAHIARDLNGDGRDDIVLPGQIDETSVWLGGEALSTLPDFVVSNPGCGSGQGYTWKVDAVGDLNGDGFNELAVTNDFCPGGRGTIWLYFNLSWLNPEPVITLRGWEFDTWGLREAATVGDVNGDGVDDLGIGAFEDFDFRGWAGILAGNPDIHVSVDSSPPAIVDELEISVFPNPFNSATTLSFDLASPTSVTIAVFDITGREVMSRGFGKLSAGRHSQRIDGSELATGIYFARVTAAGIAETVKMALIG